MLFFISIDYNIGLTGISLSQVMNFSPLGVFFFFLFLFSLEKEKNKFEEGILGV